VATAPATERPPRARLLGSLGLLVSVVAVALVVVWALGQEPPSLPDGRGELAALAGAVLLYFVVAAVRGERWRVLLRRAGAHPSRTDANALVAVGYMGNNLLPARAGDALRVVLMAPRARTGARTVLGTLIAERVLDVAVLLSLFALLAYGVVSGTGIDVSDRLRLALAVAAGVGVLALAAAAVLHRTGRLRRALAFLRPLATATADLRGRHGARVLALTVLSWALEGVVWWLAAVAADLGIGLLDALYLLALASVFVLVPAGPGYAGTLDAAVVIGATALGAGSAVTYLVVLRFVLMVPITLAGAAAGAVRYGGPGAVRAALAR